jgi:hypothetical protein
VLTLYIFIYRICSCDMLTLYISIYRICSCDVLTLYVSIYRICPCDVLTLYVSFYRICWLCVFLFIESVHVTCWLCIFLFLESVHVKDDLLHIIGERNQYHHYIMWAEDSCYNRVTGTVTVTTFNGVGPSLNFLHLLKFSIYSKKFFHNFLLSESSFTCPGVMVFWTPW